MLHHYPLALLTHIDYSTLNKLKYANIIICGILCWEIFGWSSKGIEKCKYLTVMGRPDGSKVKFTADIFDISISLFDMSVSKTPKIPCSTFNNSFLCLLMLINCNAEPVPPGTNQYRLLLTQYHHVPNRTTLFTWSSIFTLICCTQMVVKSDLSYIIFIYV